MELVITKVANPRNPDQSYALKIRDHGPADTDYYHLCYVDHWTAHQLIDMGSAFWLYGDPEQTKEVAALREQYPALAAAWEHYQMLKQLVQKSKP